MVRRYPLLGLAPSHSAKCFPAHPCQIAIDQQQDCPRMRWTTTLYPFRLRFALAVSGRFPLVAGEVQMPSFRTDSRTHELVERHGTKLVHDILAVLQLSCYARTHNLHLIYRSAWAPLFAADPSHQSLVHSSLRRYLRPQVAAHNPSKPWEAVPLAFAPRSDCHHRQWRPIRA